MVNRKNLKKKFALISVYNKNKLKYLCSNLIKHNNISSFPTVEDAKKVLAEIVHQRFEEVSQ